MLHTRDLSLPVELLNRGAVLVPHALDAEEHFTIMEHVTSGEVTFERAKERPSEHVKQDMCEFQLEDTDQRCFAFLLRLFRDRVQDRLEELGFTALQFETELDFNKIRIHLYPEGSRGITNHVDGTSNLNLIVVFMLGGSALFSLYDGRPGKKTATFLFKTGDAIIMRSCGFCHERFRSVENGGMVYHDFIPDARGCLTLGLRQEAK